VAMDSVQWKLADGKVINQTPYHPTYDAISARLAMGVEDFYPNYSYNPYARYHDDGDNTDNETPTPNKKSVRVKKNIGKEALKAFIGELQKTMEEMADIDTVEFNLE